LNTVFFSLEFDRTNKTNPLHSSGKQSAATQQQNVQFLEADIDTTIIHPPESRPELHLPHETMSAAAWNRLRPNGD
jgi:hypothetical protein